MARVSSGSLPRAAGMIRAKLGSQIQATVLCGTGIARAGQSSARARLEQHAEPGPPQEALPPPDPRPSSESLPALECWPSSAPAWGSLLSRVFDWTTWTWD